MTPPARVVVANSSSNPETIHAAAGLAEAGMLARYHLPLATAPRHGGWARRLLPGRPGRAIESELQRRALPEGIPRSAVRHTATLSDLRRVAVGRLRGSEAGTRSAYRHRDAFDRGVASALGPDDDALIAIAGIARRSVERARELAIPTVLDCPLGHHRAISEMMREEIRRQPDWAGTMQGHDLSEAQLSAYEREIEDADLLLVLSSHARKSFTERGIAEEKMVTTPLGVDLDLFTPADRRDDGRFRVIFVGQITQRKGISYLVEAFREASIADSELVLVGQVIGTAAPWNDVPGVRHVPPVPRSRLPELYRQSDAYVLPSLAEGFPLTTLEAMASGLPVIVSANTFAEDVITEGEDGFIVPIRDSDAIAERLRELAADADLRAGVGQAARRHAEEFPWSAYRQRVVEIMRGLPPPPPSPA